ncbi:hypothetical protein BGX33_009520 [Mortierella sp. NVP41]|nr:hypothetical protein BGX33_009520 [Mortierella sp. NVP41]
MAEMMKIYWRISQPIEKIRKRNNQVSDSAACLNALAASLPEYKISGIPASLGDLTTESCF